MGVIGILSARGSKMRPAVPREYSTMRPRSSRKMRGNARRGAHLTVIGQNVIASRDAKSTEKKSNAIVRDDMFDVTHTLMNINDVKGSNLYLSTLVRFNSRTILFVRQNRIPCKKCARYFIIQTRDCYQFDHRDLRRVLSKP